MDNPDMGNIGYKTQNENNQFSYKDNPDMGNIGYKTQNENNQFSYKEY